jgi:dihydroorotase
MLPQIGGHFDNSEMASELRPGRAAGAGIIAPAMQTLTITRPDDWHLHLRDGAALGAVLPHSARQFARAIVMPNLRPPVTTVAEAAAYRGRILAALPEGSTFEPLMTLYLTDNTAPEEIARAKQSGLVHAVKYYPAGATTNSDSGVTALARCFGALAAMEKAGLPLLLHGEVTGPEVDVFDREQAFIDTVLPQITRRFPGLRLVLEHITTKEAAEYVAAAPANVAATVTAHHLLLNRNAMFAGGMRPHHYCLPLLKREGHRLALVAAATGGSPKYFLGTDSAPHARVNKEAPCGHAGIYTAHAAIELYAEAFEAAGALDKLEAFASFHGADFYRLPRNAARITLRRESWQVQAALALGEDELVPLRAGERLAWRLQ